MSYSDREVLIEVETATRAFGRRSSVRARTAGLAPGVQLLEVEGDDESVVGRRSGRDEYTSEAECSIKGTR